MPYNKGDFTQQGINGDVSALVRLNEKRLMKVVLSSDDESDNCDISGAVYDLLNGTSYPLGGSTPTGTITITENGESIDVAQYRYADVNVSGVDIYDFTLTINAPPEGLGYTFGYTKLVLSPYIHSKIIYPDPDNLSITSLTANDVLLDKDSYEYGYPNVGILWDGVGDNPLDPTEYTIAISNYSNCTVNLDLDPDTCECYPTITIDDITVPSASLTLSFTHK